MSVPAMRGIMGLKLISRFKENNVITPENAVSLQEIIDKWGLGGIEPIRTHAIEKKHKVFTRIGKLQKTDDEKYYLNT